MGQTDSSFPAESILLTLVVVAAVVGVTGAVFDDVGAEIQQDAQTFEEYCTDRFGDDARVYNSQSLGPHGGLHCADGVDGEVVHFSAIPMPMLDAYARGDVSTAAVTRSVDPPPTFLEWIGPPFAVVALLVGLIAVAVQIGPRT